MNQMFLTGLLADEPVTRGTQGGKMMVTFDIASRRKYKNSKGIRETDYVPCKAFGMSADFLRNNFQRGDPIEVRGEMQMTRVECEDGKTRKFFTLCIDEISFPPFNPDGRQYKQDSVMLEEMREQATAKPGFRELQNRFEDMTPVDDGELPF